MRLLAAKESHRRAVCQYHISVLFHYPWLVDMVALAPDDQRYFVSIELKSPHGSNARFFGGNPLRPRTLLAAPTVAPPRHMMFCKAKYLTRLGSHPASLMNNAIFTRRGAARPSL
jgi:hypothetical protein